MDIFLGKVTQQAMNYAIRSGITITASYAIKQTSRLLKTAEGDEKDELQDLQLRLESKIKIISPAIDMIELISARGNTSLESAVTLTKSLRYEIQSLGQRLATAAENEENMQARNSKTQDRARHLLELRKIAQDIRKLLTRIEDAVPLISLAITASGANLSSNLPTTVSPSRLLQASTFLTAGDSLYGINPGSVQIGPIFTLSTYMLFRGHVRPQNEEDVRTSTWKEVIHKADVRLMRVPIRSLYELSSTSLDDVRPDEYAYQVRMIEDLEDDRVHTFEPDEPQPTPFGDIPLAGIREVLPVHEISKIFYADTGKILNIGSEGETNNPVLLLKRDVNASPPRRMIDYSEIEESQNDFAITDTSKPTSPALSRIGNDTDQQAIPKSDPWRLPQDLDPEWIAFEVYTEAPDSDTEIDLPITSPPSQKPSHRPSSASPTTVTSSLSNLKLSPDPSSSSLPSTPQQPHTSTSTPPQPPALPPIRTSLSLLETLLRLLSLQQFQQSPHLSIPDELLTFFLSDSASNTGIAAGDSRARRALREDAKRTVGFDPYDESPIKRHGEEYQYGYGGGEGSWDRGTTGDGEWDGLVEGEEEGATFASSMEGEVQQDEGYGTASVLDPRMRKPGSPSTPLRPRPVTRLSGRLRQTGNGGGGGSSGGRSSPLAKPPSTSPSPAATTKPAERRASGN